VVVVVVKLVKGAATAHAAATRHHLLQNPLRMPLRQCSPRRIWMRMPSVPYRRVHWDRRLRTGASRGKNVKQFGGGGGRSSTRNKQHFDDDSGGFWSGGGGSDVKSGGALAGGDGETWA
jgi:hypothetical protein